MTGSSALQLFHAPDSRSSRIIWLLEELGLQYQLIHCDIVRRSGGAPDPRNPHPDRRVPALLHDGVLVTEQAAIALYLTDAFPAAGLGPVVGTVGRAAYLTWLAFYAGEADAVIAAHALYGDQLHPLALQAAGRVVARVAAALAHGSYLLGEACTAADILMTGPFEWDPQLFGGGPAVSAWLERLAERPAADRARARDAVATG